jgi:hypothetical protein
MPPRHSGPAAASTAPGRFALAPPVTPQLLAQAQASPGQQIYVVDPEFDPAGEVPGWGIRGFFPVSAEGALLQQDWVPNPHYRPGPLTLGFPQPRSWLERALQLAAAGHQSEHDLLAALVASEVVIPTAADHPDQVPVVADKQGRDTVALFTRAELLPADVPHLEVAIAVLAPLLPTVTVVINPGQRPSAEIPGTDLAAALATTPAPAGPRSVTP